MPFNLNMTDSLIRGRPLYMVSKSFPNHLGAGVSAQRVLEHPGQLGVPVGHVGRLLGHVAEGADHVAQGQQAAVDGDAWKCTKESRFRKSVN